MVLPIIEKKKKALSNAKIYLYLALMLLALSLVGSLVVFVFLVNFVKGDDSAAIYSLVSWLFSCACLFAANRLAKAYKYWIDIALS